MMSSALTMKARATTTVAERAPTTLSFYSYSSQSQQTSTLSPYTTLFRSASSVNAGSVTFQVKQGASNVGSAVTDTSVVAGAASVTYSLPAGTAAGGYTVVATYNPSTNLDRKRNSMNSSNITTWEAATRAIDANSSYSEQAVDVMLAATASAIDSLSLHDALPI